MYQPARAAQHRSDRARQQLAIALGADEPAPDQREIVVIRRDALERPQLPRVILAREVVGHERRGLDALDVPRVEIFVAREPQESEVAVIDAIHAGMRQFVAAAEEARARPVFESRVAVADSRDLEQIAIEGRAAEEVDLPLAHALEVAREPRQVGRLPAGDRDVMRYAAGFEGRQRKVAGLDRVVDQFVVVRGAVGAEAIGGRARAQHRRGHAPARVGRPFRRHDVDDARCVLAAFRKQEHRRSVEVAARGVEVGGAHRQIVRIDLCHHRQRADAWCGLPDVLAGLRDRHGMAAGLCPHGHEMSREFADRIAAGSPGW